MSATYAWVIDRDHLAETWGDPTNNVGLTGPRDAPRRLITALFQSTVVGYPFRIRDDDGILYYSGRAAFKGRTTPETADETAAFGPLDDFGRPNDGATTIEYRTPAGDWEAL